MPKGHPLATVLGLSDGRWKIDHNVTVMNNPKLPTVCYIFLAKKLYPNDESGRGDLLRPFNVPSFLNTDTCTELNGYFGCRGKYNENEKLESYSTWFRCLVKMVLAENEIGQSQKPYKWYEMGFFTRWDNSDSCRVLCVDTPEDLVLKLKDTLDGSPLNLRDPFAMHIPIVDQLIKLYDESVWRVRDPVRIIEKNRQSSGPDFEKLHEISRHAIHVSEVLSVAIVTLQRIQDRQKAVYGSLPQRLSKTDQEQAEEYVAFLVQVARSLLSRSNSNHERLKDEIGLVRFMETHRRRQPKKDPPHKNK